MNAKIKYLIDERRLSLCGAHITEMVNTNAICAKIL